MGEPEQKSSQTGRQKWTPKEQGKHSSENARGTQVSSRRDHGYNNSWHTQTVSQTDRQVVTNRTLFAEHLSPESRKESQNQSQITAQNWSTHCSLKTKTKYAYRLTRPTDTPPQLSQLVESTNDAKILPSEEKLAPTNTNRQTNSANRTPSQNWSTHCSLKKHACRSNLRHAIKQNPCTVQAQNVHQIDTSPQLNQLVDSTNDTNISS